MNQQYPPGGYPGFPQQQQYGQQPQQPGQFMQQPPPFGQGQFQQPAYPPQQAPMTQQQVPFGGFQPPPGFQPTQAPGPTQMQAAPPPTSGGFYIPSEAVIRSSYQSAQDLKKKIMQARSGNFSKLRFFQILGPNGQAWKTAFVSYVGAKAIYLMPSWKEGAMNYVDRITHFWKSKTSPQGTSINSAGEDSLIAKAYNLALEQGVKSPWCRPQKKYVYQGFPYEFDAQTGQITGIDPSQCIHEDGTLRPMLLEAGGDVHTMIQEISNTRSFLKVFHPDYGRPIVIKKTKTGPEAINVDYAVIDLDQQPLAEPYRQGLQYLYALDELFKPATLEEQIAAIIDSNLPMPPEAGGFQGQAQTGWSPQGQFQQQQQMQQPNPYGNGMPPQGMPQQQMIPPGNMQQPQSFQQFPNPPAPNPWGQPQQQQPLTGPGGMVQPQQGWPPPPQGMPQQPAGPKPLPPIPQGMGQMPNAPMIPPGTQPPPMGGMPQQVPQQMQMMRMPIQGPPQGMQPGMMMQPPPPQQQQGQKPLTPEDLQKQLQGDADVPF
jgi:hypothetical protein